MLLQPTSLKRGGGVAAGAGGTKKMAGPIAVRKNVPSSGYANYK